MSMENFKYTEDRKPLGTVHTLFSVDEYYHVRKKEDGKTTFRFVVVSNTKNGTREYEISESQIPKDIRPL